MGKRSEPGLAPQPELDADAAATRSIAENSPDNIMLLDREARIRYLNWTVPGLTREEVYGTSLYDYSPVEFRDVIRQCLARVLETGRADRYEATYISKDGDISCWESRVGAVMHGDEVVGFAHISSNVTERRQAAADRDRFFNLSVDMLCVVSDRHFMRLNPAWQRVLGYSEEELLARPILDFIHPDDHDNTRAKVRELENGQNVLDFENRYRHQNGSYRWFSWRAAWEPERRVIHAIARDVTEQRQLHMQLRQSQKMEAIGQLAAGIAHDFNNLILVMAVNAELARDAADLAHRAEHLAEIGKAAQRARDLTRQLLTFGRHSLTHSAAVDAGVLVRDLAKMLQPLLAANIELQLEVGMNLPTIEGDPGQLEQVILNLCLNARDAMPNGGKLIIRVDALDAAVVRQFHSAKTNAPAYVRITVQDDGVGMSAEVKERLFEPFFTTKPAGKGTGLGLSTAYGIVQGHGGFLRVESELDRGSRVEVFLLAKLERSVAVVAPPAAQSEAARGETVLVVEDEDSVRNVVARMLTRAGYRVLTASDGERAIAMFRAHQAEIDLVLLDVVMPKLSGPEALEQMRAIDPSVRAIFTSGYTDAANFRAVRRTGAPLIPKPYEPAALLQGLRKVLDEQR